MNKEQRIEERRRSAVEELMAIRSMRKGTVNEQWFPVVRDGKKTGELRGPYYVHSYKVGKKSVSARLKSEAAVLRAQGDTENHRRFKALCTEFEELTEQLGLLERDAASEEVKKGLKSRSGKAGK